MTTSVAIKPPIAVVLTGERLQLQLLTSAVPFNRKTTDRWRKVGGGRECEDGMVGVQLVVGKNISIKS